jgi:hypothetical protein
MTTKKKLTDEAAAENPAVKETLAQHDDPLPGAPAAPPKKQRTETLHIAYLTDGTSTEPPKFEDVAVFGTKLDAYEFAFEQTPKWDVKPIRKGQTLRDAIESA